jgi:tetratricopeptide (TPR) repeat protein
MVLAAELDQMVLVLETLGKADEADVLSGRASAIWDRLLAEFPDYKPVAAEGARRPAEWLLSAPGRDPERALALTRRVVELDPKDQLGWKWLGVAEYRSGHWAAAIEAAEKCIALRGDGGWAFQFLVIALSHARLGNTDRAREWYAKAGRPLGNEEMADTPRWLILEAASLLGAERPRDEAKPKVPGKPTHPPG